MVHYTESELRDLGFGSVGKGVRISRLASFHNPGAIHLGDHVRIDDFCVLSAGAGGIHIGAHIHIAVFCALIGAGRIELRDFCNLSSRVSIYTSNDDYSGAFMTNPTVPAEFTNVATGPVTVGRHAIIGSGSVILPNVVLGEGAVVGALSLVARDCDPFQVYGGVPARLLKERRRDLLEVEERFNRARAESAGGAGN